MAEEFHEKQRIIQEFVPGKQVTLAHVISNPDESLYKKMGVIGETSGALGIMTITPSEGAIIGADVASKAANINVVFVDRFNGSLVVNGDVAERRRGNPGRFARADERPALYADGDYQDMKKIVLVGNVACGKTTLCQRLNGLKLQYEKTQALNVVNCTIDTRVSIWSTAL